MTTYYYYFLCIIPLSLLYLCFMRTKIFFLIQTVAIYIWQHMTNWQFPGLEQTDMIYAALWCLVLCSKILCQCLCEFSLTFSNFKRQYCFLKCTIIYSVPMPSAVILVLTYNSRIFVYLHTKHFVDSLRDTSLTSARQLLQLLHWARFVLLEQVNFLCHKHEQSFETEASQLPVHGPGMNCFRLFACPITLLHFSTCLKHICSADHSVTSNVDNI